MIGLWRSVKSYGVLLLTGLLSLLGFLSAFFYSRSRKATADAKEQRARYLHAKHVMEADKEIELEHDTRTEALADEIESKGTSGELSDPNRW